MSNCQSQPIGLRGASKKKRSWPEEMCARFRVAAVWFSYGLCMTWFEHFWFWVRSCVPSRLRVASPGQRSCAIVCLASVLVLLRSYVSATCLFCCLFVIAWFSAVLYATLRTAKCWDTTFGVLSSCWDSCSLLRLRGRFPQWGGTCTPRYCGPPG